MNDMIFSPSFGNRPSSFVGRDEMLGQLIGGLTFAPGSRERAVVLLGQHGLGKTALLWELADRMRQQNFVVATPTIVSESMLERIVEKIIDDADAASKGKTRISGGSVGVFGFSAGLQLQREAHEPGSPQHQLTQLCRTLTKQGRGVLILVDELQANTPEVKQLIITYQELVGEGLNVAIVLAGLPGAVSATLNDKALTFLNRARKIALEPLALGDVDAFLARSFRKIGLSIDGDLRRTASAFTAGSPYLLQLVGHNTVQYAEPDGAVTAETLADALRTSQEDFENDVCRTTLAALSEKDVKFLEALAVEGSESSIAAIADRMGVTPDYAQKYRKRLIDAGIIQVAGRGRVAMAVPYLSDHLQRQRN